MLFAKNKGCCSAVNISNCPGYMLSKVSKGYSTNKFASARPQSDENIQKMSQLLNTLKSYQLKTFSNQFFKPSCAFRYHCKIQRWHFIVLQS